MRTLKRASAPILFALPALALIGCAAPREYPPPQQKSMPEGRDPLPRRELIRMSEADADAYIERGMFPAGGGYSRWTGVYPRFRLWLDGREGRELYLHFSIPESAFKQTGPITVSISIDGQAFAAPVFDAAREYEYRMPVPANFLSSVSPAIVGLDIDPTSAAGADGERLGVYLEAIGLVKGGSR